MGNKINTSDLRKGNLVLTEYGVLPVCAISFGDVQVKGKDGRILWPSKVEGWDAQNITSFGKATEQIKELEKIFKSVDIPDSGIQYVHEVQNWYYWNSGKKELEITISSMPYDKFAFQRNLVGQAIKSRLLGIPVQEGFSKFHLKEKYQNRIKMKKYLGVKVVEAEPMGEIEFINKVRNEDVPKNFVGRQGYKVVYEDGYVSWSPKDVFEKAYKEYDEKHFFRNIDVFHDGDWRFSIADEERITGKCLNSNKPTEASKFFPFGVAIEELKAGKRVARTGWNGKGMWLKIMAPAGGKVNLGHNGFFDGLPWIGMKTADEKFVPWLASQTDMLAEDWQIVE